MIKEHLETESSDPTTMETSTDVAEAENQSTSREDSEDTDLGLRHVYAKDKVVRTMIQPKLQFDPSIFELMREVSYRDGIDNPNELTGFQVEAFIESAVREKIDRCLKEYATLGEIHSRRLQRRYKHLVTLKEVPNPDSPGGLGTKLVPLDYETTKREYASFTKPT